MLLGNFLYDLTPQLPFYLTMALTIPMMLIVVFRISEPKKENREICKKTKDVGVSLDLFNQSEKEF